MNLYESQYFRSLGINDAHVRLTAANNEDNSRSVYVVWDDRPQKRIFFAKSTDGGANWNTPLQLKGPEDFTGSSLPFNVNVSATKNGVLLLWQAGDPGSRCTQYSQWSEDGGIQFTEPVKMGDEFVLCPKRTDFISQSDEFSVVLLGVQDDISLIAWNGSRWSDLQTQNELSGFLNPITFDNVILACQHVSLLNVTLYVVGCDKGLGGDIWLRSRPLGDLEDWFPPASAWTSPGEVTSAKQKISSLASVADAQNNVHAFWVQAPLLDVDKADATIQYARWNGGKWSKPVSILSGFGSIPVQLSSIMDSQGRLFLVWNEGKNGDLYFSWVNADRANVPSEWSAPQQISIPSQISSFPNILVDDSGKIIVAYSVPLNEDRGIYTVQSDNLGKTWSQLVLVFDGVAADWDLVDQPRMDLSRDGRLHLLFSGSSLREADQSGELYYTQSLDGGSAWSQPEVVSEKPILWSQIVDTDKQTLHRLWQENNGITLDVFHQISRDGGETWENAVKVFGVTDPFAEISLAKDWEGHLYLTQTRVENRRLIVEVSEVGWYPMG